MTMYELLRMIGNALVVAPDEELRTFGSVVRGDTLYLANEDVKYELTLKRVPEFSDQVTIEAIAQYLYYQDALEPMRWHSQPERIQTGYSQFKEGWGLWENSNPALKEQYRQKASTYVSTKGETSEQRKP